MAFAPPSVQARITPTGQDGAQAGRVSASPAPARGSSNLAVDQGDP